MSQHYFVLWVAAVRVVGAASASSCANEVASGSGQCNQVKSTEHLLLQHRVSVRERLNTSEQQCDLLDVEKKCSSNGCKVLATNMRGRSCSSYCRHSGYDCVGAWEEVEEDCNVKFNLTCEDSYVPTSDLICQCAPRDSSAAVVSQPDWVILPTFFWNVHWECSLAANGASGACKHKVGHRFVELALAAKAEVVASVELSDGSSRPSDLTHYGLKGWTQVDGPCKYGHRGDAAALAFAPNWRVVKSSGGCLRWDSDTRAFAVALVVPPKRVKGCPQLCFVGIHAPHASITKGWETVQEVCGNAAERCAVAMGDWNVPAERVGHLWSKLISSNVPTAAFPNQRTCCFPESHHYGVFDHIATNIRGAVHDNQLIHPYQILEENPVKQHRAVTARVLLPRS